jgi:murein DD-endopeptidase MepM/ murein hydrolase activator NlpD
VPSFDIKEARQFLVASPAPRTSRPVRMRGLMPYALLAVGFLAASYGVDAFFARRGGAPTIVATKTAMPPVVLTAVPPMATPTAAVVAETPAETPAPLAAAVPAATPIPFYKPAPPEAESSMLDQARLSEERAHLAKLRQAGLDPEKLLRRAGIAPARAEGGPFVALGDMRTAPQDDRRLAQLRSLLKTMPFAAPLIDFSVGSPFGPRRDPFNARIAFHTGLDLEAPFRSPVFSTAPGQIVFAGVKDAYGRCIEIDHGNGLVTRYAHLNRILVAPGQHVGAHQQIGELGSTGRSTGPHLHYEVLFDGRPQDPAKFLRAGATLKAAALARAAY